MILEKELTMLNSLSRERLDMLMRSAESVTPGHPDKICDQVADGLVDEVMRDGKDARMAAEVTGGHGSLFITGEGRSHHQMAEFEARATQIANLVYEEVAGDTLDQVIYHLVQQCPEISQGVDPGGAGDQGCMIGFATDETPEMLPLPFAYARRLTNAMYKAAMDHSIPWMGTDGKSVVVMQGQHVKHVTIAILHNPDVTDEQIKRDLMQKIIVPQIGELPVDVTLTINGAGRWTIGGFAADAGTTGRKLIVDNYGPEVSIGGGAYSGKDPTKVDRSAAYMARYIAKNIVAHKIGGASRAFVQLAYTIGVPDPNALVALAYNDVSGSVEDVSAWVRRSFDLRPRAIIEQLNLIRPIYRQVNVGGHYGHTSDHDVWTWEAINSSLS
jgi:S-adenosylmethionine synthetase